MVATSRDERGSPSRGPRPSPRPASPSGRRIDLGEDGRWLLVGTTAIAVAVIGGFHLSWDLTVGLFGPAAVLGGLGAATVAIVRSTARISDLSNFVALAVCGLVAKAVGTWARYYVTNTVYERGDELTYHESAVTLGERIHDGVWSLAGTPIEPYGANTQAISWMLGSVYSVTGGSRVFGFIVFSWMSWLAIMLFYRAFRTAFPDLTSRPFAVLVFFLPSLVYWPSTVGKESFMLMWMGLAALGMAKLAAGVQPARAVVFVLAGGAGLSLVRPHMALLLLGAAVPAMLLGGGGAEGSKRRVSRVVVLILLAPALALAVTRVEQYFGGGAGWFSAGTERAADQTAIGGSSFDAQPVRSPLDLPEAAVGVVLRPFPWQADGAPALAASLEGLMLAGLALWNWRVVGRLFKMAFNARAVAFCLSYVVLFIVAFSNINNAGILARQRTQMIPFLLFAGCAAWAATRRADDPAHGASEAPVRVPLRSVAPARVGAVPRTPRGARPE